MPISSRTLRPLLLVLTGTTVAGWIAGCATERLEASAPSGVNLAGDWVINLNLSDDPSRLGTQDFDKPQLAPGSGSHHGRGGAGHGGGGGGIPQMGDPDGPSYQIGAGQIGAGENFANNGSGAPGSNMVGVGAEAPSARETALSGYVSGSSLVAATSAPALVVAQGGPPPSSDAGAPPSGGQGGERHSGMGKALQAAERLLITQTGTTIKMIARMSDGTTAGDQFIAGTDTTVPYGDGGSAERSAGWRGPVFVVTTKPKKGSPREDDFALDDDGRLIATTFAKAGRQGKVDIKRVYDRVKG